MKKHLTAETAAPAPASSLNVISFYRHQAGRCETAARNAPNEKMRAELSRMVHIWREFAAEHERMLREGRDLNVRLNQSVKGWM